MTTIAFKDGIVATDTLVTSNDSRFGFAVKIACIGGLVAAGVGSAPICRAFLDWVRAGLPHLGPKMEMDDNNSASGYIFMGRDQIVSFGPAGVNLIRAPYFAAGSGHEFARGAMAAGLSAEQAVASAIEGDIYSGGGIILMKVDPATSLRCPPLPMHPTSRQWIAA